MEEIILSQRRCPQYCKKCTHLQKRKKDYNTQFENVVHVYYICDLSKEEPPLDIEDCIAYSQQNF
jgi:hypothetical protein